MVWLWCVCEHTHIHTFIHAFMHDVVPPAQSPQEHWWGFQWCTLSFSTAEDVPLMSYSASAPRQLTCTTQVQDAKTNRGTEGAFTRVQISNSRGKNVLAITGSCTRLVYTDMIVKPQPKAAKSIYLMNYKQTTAILVQVSQHRNAINFVTV